MELNGLSGLSGIFSPYESDRIAARRTPSAYTNANTSASGDSVSISSEARDLYAQLMVSQRMEKTSSAGQHDLQAPQSEADDAAQLMTQYSEMLSRRTSGAGRADDTSGKQGSDADNAGSGGGGGSGNEPTNQVEDLQKQIAQVSAELSSSASRAASTNTVGDLSRVNALQAQLGQLEAQLSQLLSQAKDAA